MVTLCSSVKKKMDFQRFLSSNSKCYILTIQKQLISILEFLLYYVSRITLIQKFKSQHIGARSFNLTDTSVNVFEINLIS